MCVDRVCSDGDVNEPLTDEARAALVAELPRMIAAGAHDAHLLAVVDGRDTLPAECRACPAELRAYLGARFRGLLDQPALMDALPGHLPGDAASQKRLPELVAKLREIAGLSQP